MILSDLFPESGKIIKRNEPFLETAVLFRNIFCALLVRADTSALMYPSSGISFLVFGLRQRLVVIWFWELPLRTLVVLGAFVAH
jgi:hypothetical protein